MSYSYTSLVEPEALIGLTFDSVTRTDNSILFSNTTQSFSLEHYQECCEDVYIESISGDLSDLVGTPIVKCEIVTSGDPPPSNLDYSPDSFTWSFVKLATIKGYVDIRFFGSSNGYYAEDAQFFKIPL